MMPFLGIFLLLFLRLIARTGRGPGPVPARFHLLNIIGIVVLVSLGRALLGALALFDGRGSTLTISIGAVGSILLIVALGIRHLYLDMRDAAPVGAFFSLSFGIEWYLIATVDYANVSATLDLLLFTFPLWMLLFIAILIVETHRQQDRSGARGQTVLVDRADRTWRVGEVWTSSALVALAMFVLLGTL
jgi:hypothetical protein